VPTLTNARWDYIKEQLHKHGNVQVAGLAADMGVSEVTVRRYLAQMEAEGLLVRFYGGAIPPAALVPDVSFRDKVSAHLDAKRAIGAAAAARVADGSTIALGAGTTVMAIASALAERRNITVVTNAINIAWELTHRPEIRLVVTGGVLREPSYALTGRAAEHALRDLFVDLAFVGANGVSPVHGFTTPNPEEAHITRALLGRAARSVVVADHSKWGRVAFAQIAQPSEVKTVITDDQAPPEMVESFRRIGVEVVTA
jgi:DeoR/GlpR family transcriptional regulator of sugar metabolism